RFGRREANLYATQNLARGGWSATLPGLRYAVANRRALARFNPAQYRGEPPGIEILTCTMSVLCHALVRNPSPGRVAVSGQFGPFARAGANVADAPLAAIPAIVRGDRT